MTAPVFVDSNVFLYAMDEADPRNSKPRGTGAQNCGRTAWGGSALRCSVSSMSMRCGNVQELAMRHAPKSAICWHGILCRRMRLLSNKDGKFKTATNYLLGRADGSRRQGIRLRLSIDRRVAGRTEVGWNRSVESLPAWTQFNLVPESRLILLATARTPRWLPAACGETCSRRTFQSGSSGLR